MITPLDIENKKFNKQMMNGYNVDEVDDFLDEIQEDYEKNYRELATAKSKIDELTTSLEHYKNIETTLQNTLVMAQKTAEEVKNVAKQKSEQIINEAQQHSEELIRLSKESSKKAVNDLDDQINSKEKELDDLKKQFDIYKAKMESTDKQKKKDYYAEGINLLLQSGENIDNYTTILEEYKAALVVREKRVDDLYNEIKIIKKLKV